VFLEKKERYEVIKFVEHGGRCRLTMDYVQGELLIDRLKGSPELSKADVFDWFRLLAFQLDQYHRYSKQQSYRYLSPYSILITEQNQPVLLDLAAGSNDFALKNLQKRPMRQHFLKVVVHTWEDPKLSRDLFGIAKIMQFTLAHAQVTPSLTKSEAHRLSRIIEKCLCENPKKQYESLKQIQKDIPKTKKNTPVPLRKLIVILAATLALLSMVVVISNVFSSSSKQVTEKMESDTAAELVDPVEQMDAEGMMGAMEETEVEHFESPQEVADSHEPQDMVAELRMFVDKLDVYFGECEEVDYPEIILLGAELKRKVDHHLEVYDREMRTKEVAAALLYVDGLVKSEAYSLAEKQEEIEKIQIIYPELTENSEFQMIAHSVLQAIQENQAQTEDEVGEESPGTEEGELSVE